MRYFAKVDLKGNPLALFRLGLDAPDAKFEMVWDKDWVPTDLLVKALVDGSMDYEEITPEIASLVFPDAFIIEVIKNIGKYEVSKAEGEKRYTLGAMYIPDRIDAHGEWTDSDELQKAVWDYVKSNDRRIRLQHNRDVVAGEWVEVMAFPYELTVPIKNIDGLEVSHTYPANTVFLGVIWEPWAWELVKSGKILGYSIGGKAERLYVDMEEVEKEDGPGVSDVHVDTIMNPKKKKPKDK
ncbi:Phage-like element PBSX protein, XkdF [uncultured Caudovirales phage]|uniref:Phage-like element PBSX protein, XkdF n=1 Tax=uncultured Caudovirales phage TaxID=2100421 RepID=A0A6J5ND77_9CAUD|nr:Phage-like element PBSX protein, XkdF [uncultured Caudovirales phage]